MMNLGDNAVFLDTNVLVYANVASAPWHKAALEQIQQLWDNGHDLWISRQVIREFLAVLTRPQTFSQPGNAIVTIAPRPKEAQIALISFVRKRPTPDSYICPNPLRIVVIWNNTPQTPIGR